VIQAADRVAQLLLVRAAVLPGACALDAWREWQHSTRMESLEPDSQWLLPLLYANLRRAGVPEPPLRRYANVYRHNWYKNQLLLRVAERLLSSVGAPVLLLGEAALATGYYPLLGARPIESLNLFCADPAGLAQCLEETSWHRLADQREGRLALVDAFGRRVALCAAVIDAEQDAGLLARARPLRLGGMRAPVERA